MASGSVFVFVIKRIGFPFKFRCEFYSQIACLGCDIMSHAGLRRGDLNAVVVLPE